MQSFRLADSHGDLRPADELNVSVSKCGTLRCFFVGGHAFRSSPCKISISSGVRTASLLPATIVKAKRMIGRIIGIWRDWQRPNPTKTTTFWLCPRKVCSCTKAMKFCPWHITCQWPPWFTWNSPEFNLFQWTFLVHAANNTAGCWWICFNLYSWYYFRAWNMSLWSSRFWLMSARHEMFESPVDDHTWVDEPPGWEHLGPDEERSFPRLLRHRRQRLTNVALIEFNPPRSSISVLFCATCCGTGCWEGIWRDLGFHRNLLYLSVWDCGVGGPL